MHAREKTKAIKNCSGHTFSESIWIVLLSKMETHLFLMIDTYQKLALPFSRIRPMYSKVSLFSISISSASPFLTVPFFCMGSMHIKYEQEE